MIVLDWHERRHWNGGRHVPCRLCGDRTFLLDGAGQPCHKACAEIELEPLLRAYGVNPDTAMEGYDSPVPLDVTCLTCGGPLPDEDDEECPECQAEAVSA